MTRQKSGLRKYKKRTLRRNRTGGRSFKYTMSNRNKNRYTKKGGKHNCKSRRKSKCRPHRKPHRKNKSKSKRVYKHRGGKLISSEFANLGKGFVHEVKSISNVFRGEPAPVNPLPTRDQPIDKFDESNFGKLSAIDINNTYKKAINGAADDLNLS